MADISFLLDDSTIGKVDEHIAAVAARKPPRRYLGMSSIGDPCSRRLWLQYHAGYAPVLLGRVYRLFETGHIIERRVVRDLRKAGFEVTGRQRSFRDFKGKFRGHCDGIVSGLRESSRPHILEVKSANEKWYKEFLKEGMCSNPKYSAQSHLYMHYAGLERALFVLENKNDSARYQERVHIDRLLVKDLREKARLIIEAKFPPAGISSRPDWFECRFCDLNNEDFCRKDWEGGRPF